MKRASITTYDILVGNFNKSLQNDTVEKRVSKQFTQYGETKGLFVKESNQGKYVVVKYLSEPDADRAVEEANGILLDGTPILVKRMERRQNKPQGSGSSVVVTSGTWVASKDCPQKSQFGKNPDIVPVVEPAGSSSPGPDGEHGMSSSLNARGHMMPVQMCVTHIETPTLFWCQELREPFCTELAKLSHKLTEVCPSAPKVLGHPEPSKVYAAKYSEDGQWYRCQVKATLGSEKVRVQYIDFGNCEETSPKEMVELPADMTCIKPYAQKIMMHNTRFVGPKEKEALQYLNDITNDQVLTINPTFRLPDSTGLFAHMFVNGIHLNQDLIDRGFATPKPPKQAQPQQQLQQQQQHQQQQQQLQQQNDPLLGNQFHIGEGGGYAPVVPWGLVGGDSGGFRPGGKAGVNRGFSSTGDGFGRQVLGEADKLRIGVQRFAAPGLNRGSVPGGEKLALLPEPPCPMGQVGAQPLQQAGPAYSDLKIELANKQRALEKASAELANDRAKIRSLQQEFQVLTAKLEENNITNQLQTAVSLAEKVRRLRSQFSDDQPTAVDEAIELVRSPDKLTENSVASLSPLMATLTTYRKMQQEICQAQQKQETAEEKIEERDCVRRKLYDQLTACITEMEGMPFTERANRITQCTEKLMDHYDNFFNVPVEAHSDFQTTVTQYEDFKMKKQKEFEQTSLHTDQQHELVQTQLANIGKSLSLSLVESAEECNLDLMTLLKDYCVCMQQEISAKSVEASADGSFIASLVQTVHRDLKAEILCVNDFIRLESEFRHMQAGIEAWLDRKPSVEKLVENRQVLRSLKSKLRHKLADKHDAEENDDQDMMEAVQKEVADIQQEIHKALTVEDKELVELAMLVDTHFPELLALHADCGLDIQLKYKGIVKSNHEVNHYNLTPVPGSNGRLFFSKFADQDVIVMECLLSDGHHLSRDDFLVQLMAYTSITHHALLHPTAVFFDKNNRHAYLRFERGRGDILANHIEFGPVDHNENHLIVKSVAEALSALHEKKVLHGEVNPYSILRHPDATSSLLPPDLSCRPIDRAKNKFTSSNGLEFMAPEMTSIPSGVEPTGVVDMFCMGILILYLACPKEPVFFNPDGSPDQTKVKLEQSAYNLVKSLMSNVPHLRPTADMLLQTQYVLNADCKTSSSPKAGAVSTHFSAASSFPYVGAVVTSAPTSIPAFTMPNTQHPPPPPVNFNQPPPPLPTSYSPVQCESPYSTPPPADAFTSVSVADLQPFGEPSGLGTNSRDPSTYSPPTQGGETFYDSSNSGFDSTAGKFETGTLGGFEEAALQQEQHEKESRSTVGQFPVGADPTFVMGGEGQGEFEIGTFSIDDVNGAGPGGQGRKITRQASADEEFGGDGGGGSAEDWQAGNGQNGD